MPTKTLTAQPAKGRKALVRSVSMQPEEWNYVYQRVEDLYPRIKDRSHYFQLMVIYERQNPGFIDEIMRSLQITSGKAGGL